MHSLANWLRQYVLLVAFGKVTNLESVDVIVHLSSKVSSLRSHLLSGTLTRNQEPKV